MFGVFFSWLIFLIFSRRLNEVAFLSAGGLLVYCLVIGMTFHFGSSNITQHTNTSPINYSNFRMFGSWIGVNMFAYEGVAVALAVYEAMHLSKPGKFYQALLTTTATCVVLYSSFGIFAYIRSESSVHNNSEEEEGEEEGGEERRRDRKREERGRRRNGSPCEFNENTCTVFGIISKM